MPHDYSTTIYLPEGMVAINQQGDATITLAGNRTLTNDEFAAVATIAQVLAKLRAGKLVDYNLNLSDFENLNQVVKCEWLDSGNLAFRGVTEKLYDYKDNRDDALVAKRTFTTLRSMYNVLPKRREVIKKGSV